MERTPTVNEVGVYARAEGPGPMQVAGRPWGHSYPPATMAWILALVSVVTFVSAIPAILLAANAGRQGNRRAWFAIPVAVLGATLACVLAVKYDPN